MSEFALTNWCPGCSPGTVMDPLTEHSERCSEHPAERLEGSADGMVNTAGSAFSLYGAGEGEGTNNAAYCAILHRQEAEKC